MIKAPEISPDFTLDDIRKIRDYHSELTKNMTSEERIKFYNEIPEEMKSRLNIFKDNKAGSIV